MGAWPEKLTYSVIDDVFDNDAKPIECTSEEFIARLITHRRTPCAPCRGSKCRFKNAEAFTPGVFVYDPTERKRLRRGTHFQKARVLIFDFDGIPTPGLELLCTRVDASGYDAIIYSTHSHNPPNENKVRIVLVLSRDVGLAEYKAVWDYAVSALGLDEIGLVLEDGELVQKHDHSTRTPVQPIFFPNTPEGTTVIAARVEGPAVDVDEVIRSAPPLHTKARHNNASSVRLRQATGPVDMEDLRKRLTYYRPPETDSDSEKERKRGLIHRVREGEAIATTNRNQTIRSVMWILATIFPLDTPTEAAMEIFQPSLAKMEKLPDDKEGDWVEYARESFESGQLSALESAAARQEERNKTLEKIKEELGLGKKQPQTDSQIEEQFEASPDEQSKSGPKEGQDSVSLDSLFITTDKGAIRQVDANIAVILRNSPDWRGTLKFNDVTKRIEYTGKLIVGIDANEDAFPTSVANNIQHGPWGIFPKDNAVASQVRLIAYENRYNPLKEYLLGLKWDGQHRTSLFLEGYCRADSGGNLALQQHLRSIGSKWLLAAVARALEPGCKADNILVLVGPQGIKKSTVPDVLGGEWFASSRIDVQNKDSMMLAAANWIIELPELASLKRSESEAHKAFFSARIDTFRTAYGRTTARSPRICLFMGTTNEEEFLQDETGNRRYWPVSCGKIDIDALRRDRDMLWAEAVRVFLSANDCPECSLPDRCARHRWWLNDEEAKYAELQASCRQRRSYVQDMIFDWWCSQEPKDRPKIIQTYEVATKALHMTKLEVANDKGMHAKIGVAMKTLGFIKERKQSGNRDVFMYRASDELLNVKKTPPKKFGLSDAGSTSFITPTEAQA